MRHKIKANCSYARNYSPKIYTQLQVLIEFRYTSQWR
ncbi:hypothetical protein D918_04189 [Trichuris suis]|nr:hypothetical protein D918_04189 [Trichuris suis]